MIDSALIEILLPAYGPCPHFSGTCRDDCVWDPLHGLVPCAFGGASGSIGEVSLILVTAEPSDPADDAVYDGSPRDMIGRALAIFDRAMRSGNLGRRGRPTAFHANMRKILDLCWPELDLDAQLRRTWVTNAVLCAAPVPGGHHPPDVELACAKLYLAEQLALMPNAFVMALGGKAARRMSQANLHFDVEAQHPAARPNTNPDHSWRVAAASFRAWLGNASVENAMVVSGQPQKNRGGSLNLRCTDAPDGLIATEEERAVSKKMRTAHLVEERLVSTDLIVEVCAKALQSAGKGRAWRLKTEFRPGTTYVPRGARRLALDLAQALHERAPQGIVTEEQLLVALDVANPLMKAAGNQAGAIEWRQFLLTNKVKGGAWYEPV